MMQDNTRSTISNDSSVVYASPHPETSFAFSPSIAVLASGRLMVTLDREALSPG